MHIGFGQNTVSSLYGHQKGDHMKTIELSHKKHKANESKEKMTVTSCKDVCRRIGPVSYTHLDVYKRQLVDTGDVHCLMIGAAGVGKTAHFLYPNIEYACACGMSFLTTDTKGDFCLLYTSPLLR